VQGSVHVSSADTLHFADGTRLPTGTPTGSSFTAAPPEAFGFPSSRSGAISVTGSRLTTPLGKDLSLVGGPVRIEGGQIMVPAGKLHIASARAVSESFLDLLVMMNSRRRARSSGPLPDQAPPAPPVRASGASSSGGVLTFVESGVADLAKPPQVICQGPDVAPGNCIRLASEVARI
jgi:hypothetical protein